VAVTSNVQNSRNDVVTRCWVVPSVGAGAAHPGTSGRANAGRDAGPRTSTTPARMSTPRLPIKPTSRAPRRTLTGRGRSGSNGPKTSESERCIAARGWTEILEPSIRTSGTRPADTPDTWLGQAGQVAGTSRTRAQDPPDATPCPAATRPDRRTADTNRHPCARRSSSRISNLLISSTGLSSVSAHKARRDPVRHVATFCLPLDRIPDHIDPETTTSPPKQERLTTSRSPVLDSNLPVSGLHGRTCVIRRGWRRLCGR
jgi:hypothetical protein